MASTAGAVKRLLPPAVGAIPGVACCHAARTGSAGEQEEPPTQHIAGPAVLTLLPRSGRATGCLPSSSLSHQGRHSV